MLLEDDFDAVTAALKPVFDHSRPGIQLAKETLKKLVETRKKAREARLAIASTAVKEEPPAKRSRTASVDEDIDEDDEEPLVPNDAMDVDGVEEDEEVAALGLSPPLNQ